MEDFLRKQLELLKPKQSIFTLMWELRSREAHTVAVFLCQHCSLCLYPTSLDSARPPRVHRLSHLHNTLIGWQEAPPEKHSLPFAFSFAGTDRLAIAKIPPCTVPHQRLRQWKHREHTCQSSDGRTRQLRRVRGPGMFIRLITNEELFLLMNLWHYHQPQWGRSNRTGGNAPSFICLKLSRFLSFH